MDVFENLLEKPDFLQTFDPILWATTLNNDDKQEILQLAAERTASLSARHPEYGNIAGTILREINRITAAPTFDEFVRSNDHISDELKVIVGDDVKRFKIQTCIDDEGEGSFSFFAWATLNKSYLLPRSSPEFMFMRISLGIHGEALESAFETYRSMIGRECIHATPTLFNAGSKRPQLASCFLLAMADDSIEGIFKTLTDCAKISKSAGGIGFHCHSIRNAGSRIKGTNGTSNGLVPMLKCFGSTSSYVDQGGGRVSNTSMYPPKKSRCE